jgi:hypothetical protein
MSDALLGHKLGRRARAGAAAWLGFAAAPTFALMALVTYAFDRDADMMCSAVHGLSFLSGMAPMYVLMSAFHLAPWLRLIDRLANEALG